MPARAAEDRRSPHRNYYAISAWFRNSGGPMRSDRTVAKERIRNRTVVFEDNDLCVDDSSDGNDSVVNSVLATLDNE